MVWGMVLGKVWVIVCRKVWEKLLGMIYRLGMVNSKSFIVKVLLQIKWKF